MNPAAARLPFLRPPRRYVLPPGDEITLQPPPAWPGAPNTSLVTLLQPLAGLLLSMGLMFMFMRGGSAGYMLFSLPLMGLSAAGGLYGYVAGRRKYTRALADREKQYRAYLADMAQRLRRLRAAQFEAEQIAHPSQATWAARARQLDLHLWERTAVDRDFLTFRLGAGLAAASFSIKAPPSPPVGAPPDSLLDAAQALADEFHQMPDALVTAPLASLGAVGVCGPRAITRAACRAWLTELAGAHAPGDLNLSLIFNGAAQAHWAWARWLPHVEGEGGRRRLAVTAEEAHGLLSRLAEQQRHALESAAVADSAPRPAGPAGRHVVVVDDIRLVDWNLLRVLWNTAAETRTVAFIFIVEQAAQAPKGCQAVIELHDDAAAEAGPLALSFYAPRPTGPVCPAGSLRVIGPPPHEQHFTPDLLSPEEAEQLARALAPVQLVDATAGAAVSALPAQAPLFDLLGLSADEIVRRWETAQPYRSLAVPIGLRAGGAPLLFDLHERGHGPHGLIGGTTGSGKSELLQAILLSLAAHFSPHDLAFVLIDFKGGTGLLNICGLPHVLGLITNLDGNLTARALATLRAELKRRQTLFNQAGVTHIDDYQRHARARPEAAPLPRLVLVADEFSELKEKHADFLRDLVRSSVTVENKNDFRA